MALLAEMHRKLRAAVAEMPAAGMTPKVIRVIHGAAFHDIYHAGQIKLLRRMHGD